MNQVDEARRADHGVRTAIHGGGAGVVRHPIDGHVPAHDPYDAFDHSDVDAVGVQNGALLDVQLEERCERAMRTTRLGQAVRVAAQTLQSLSDRKARSGLDVELERFDLPHQGSATCLAALLVREDRDLERVTRSIPRVGEGRRRLDRAHRPDLTIVVAAPRH